MNYRELSGVAVRIIEAEYKIHQIDNRLCQSFHQCSYASYYDYLLGGCETLSLIGIAIYL